MRLRYRLMQLLRRHWMLAAAALVAFVSMLFVPPDEAYLGYFDWKTIGCLFCVLAVASALRNVGVFDWAARAAITRFASPCTLTMTLVLVTAVFSMAFTNDVALVIMLPLSVAALVEFGQPRLVSAVFALQALAANLCGMVTPFGNPQNIYLYSYYHVELGEFLRTMALPFALSVAGIVFATWFMTRRGVTESDDPALQPQQAMPSEGAMAPTTSAAMLDRRRIAVYVPLFVLALLAVFRVVPFGIAVIIVIVVLLILDRDALLKVDYPLLATFLCFFVFAGNMARIPALEELLMPVMSQWGLLTSALTSQVISNVPAAVLLSHFTDAWQPLLIGVNIGGAGTFVGSLASLIAIRHFAIARTMVPRLREPDAPNTASFLRLFGVVNGVFFVVLLVICQLVLG